MSTRQYVTARYIRENVHGYEGTGDDAFERMFERDKSELRDMGIPLATGFSPGAKSPDGYRINRSEYELEQIELDPDEAYAVAVAATMWRVPEVAAQTQQAITKLKASGVRVDLDPTLDAIDPNRAELPDQTLFSALIQATNEHRRISFLYRRNRTEPYARRTIEPWGVITDAGRWYVVGHDCDRQAQRIFRLSRVSGGVETSTPNAFVRPSDIDLRDIAHRIIGHSTYFEPAEIWIAAARANGLRRLAIRDTPPVARQMGGRPGAVYQVPIHSIQSLAKHIAGCGADVLVLSPQQLRDSVLERLTAAASSPENTGSTTHTAQTTAHSTMDSSEEATR